MIESIQCINFQDMVNCKSLLFQSKESFLCLNYKFLCGNIYGLVSDFGCRSWGAATCLGGRFSEHFTGKLLINNNDISENHLSQYAAFIGENTFEGINSLENLLTPKECIENSLSISKLTYSLTEIKDMFGLSNERFERNINNVSGEINRISIAINFALGKDIFCFPWLNEHDIYNVSKPILDVLKKNNKIVLIPTSQQSQVKKISDHLIIFNRSGVKYK